MWYWTVTIASLCLISEAWYRNYACFCNWSEPTNEESETAEREAEKREIGLVEQCMGIASWPPQSNRTKPDCMRLPFVSISPSSLSDFLTLDSPRTLPHLYNLVAIKSKNTSQTLGTHRSSLGSAEWVLPDWQCWRSVRSWGSAGPGWCPEDWDMYSSSSGPASCSSAH